MLNDQKHPNDPIFFWLNHTYGSRHYILQQLPGDIKFAFIDTIKFGGSFVVKESIDLASNEQGAITRTQQPGSFYNVCLHDRVTATRAHRTAMTKHLAEMSIFNNTT